ncbi:MAG: site-specific integrase [Actinomycetota bacterium]
MMKVSVQGPLEGHAQAFAAELARQGYRASSVAQQLRLVADLSRWLAAEGLVVGDLTDVVSERFLIARRAGGRRYLRSAKALKPLLGFLGDLGLAPLPSAPVLGPAEALLARYREYLVSERGLGVATARGYVDAVRPFVVGREMGATLDLVGLAAADVTKFVLVACPGRSTGSAKLVVSALRSLLRFLHFEGLIPGPLAEAVPSVAGWKLAGLPRSLSRSEVRRLLAAFDRRTRSGRRDYAMTMLLVRLGLRAGEVTALTLDDIDWRAGEILIRGKGPRVERLPLPADVGEALAGYLRRGRPATAEGRTVFVRLHAPHRALTSPAVTFAVRSAGERAGLGRLGAHQLRHTAATHMVRAGVSLPEVGQVLRHRLLLTTAIYAKVDRTGLRLVARPWPGSGA